MPVHTYAIHITLKKHALFRTNQSQFTLFMTKIALLVKALILGLSVLVYLQSTICYSVHMYMHKRIILSINENAIIIGQYYNLLFEEFGKNCFQSLKCSSELSVNCYATAIKLYQITKTLCKCNSYHKKEVNLVAIRTNVRQLKVIET